MADLAWDLIILARRIYDLVIAQREAEDIKRDARDQLDIAIDNALAKERLRKRKQAKGEG